MMRGGFGGIEPREGVERLAQHPDGDVGDVRDAGKRRGRGSGPAP